MNEQNLKIHLFQLVKNAFKLSTTVVGDFEIQMSQPLISYNIKDLNGVNWLKILLIYPL